MPDVCYLKKPRVFSLKSEEGASIPPSGHCVIRASAGTGKTYTIAKIFLDLVLAGVPVDQILIVTFTRKATAELHHRLYEELSEALRIMQRRNQGEGMPESAEVRFCLSEGEDASHYWRLDDVAGRRLLQAHDAFYRTSISTIDGMTQRILRENRDLVSISPKIDDSRKGIQTRAFEAFMRYDVHADPILRDMLCAFDVYERDDDADRLDGGTSYNGTVTLRRLLESYTSQDAESVARPAFVTSDYCGDDVAFLNDYRRRYVALQDRLMEHYGAEAEGEQRFERDLAAMLKRFNTRKSLLKDTNTGGYWPSLGKYLFTRGAQHWMRTGELFKKAAEHWLPKGQLEVFWPHEDGPPGDIAGLWLWLMAFAFSKTYVVSCHALGKYRLRLGLKDDDAWGHDDFTKKLAEALNEEKHPHAREILGRIRRRWKVALVDEFQDTSQAQWEILRRCFVDDVQFDEGVGGGTRLFLIGDPKQAIYAFRGGDVFMYRSAVETLLERGGTLCILNENYRSTPAMVDAINAIYDRHGAAGGLFDDACAARLRNDYERIEAGHRDWLCMDVQGQPVSPICLTDATKQSSGKGYYDLARVATCIADEIEQLLEDGLFFDKGGTRRPIERIYVLGERHKDFKILGDCLKMRGIAFVDSGKQEEVFQREEILELTRVMHAIAQPEKQSALAGALHTTFFSLSLSEVTAKLGESPPCQESNWFTVWHEMSQDRRRIGVVFEDVLRKTRYAERLSLFGYGLEAYGVVRAVVDYLVSLALCEGLDWGELLVRMTALRRGEAEADAEAIILPLSFGKVQFLTIHACKGLEAEVVFLLPSEASDLSQDIFFHQEALHGDGLRVRKAIGIKGVSDEDALLAGTEAAREKERRLYVAMTRAAARLYMFYTDRKQAQEDPVANVYARLHRVFMALMDQEAPGGKKYCGEPLHRHAKMARAVSEGDIRVRLADLKRYPAETQDAGRREDRMVQRPWRAGRIESYSSLSAKRLAQGVEAPQAWQQADHVPWEGTPWKALPGGTETGNFLHSILEMLDFGLVCYCRDMGLTCENWLEGLANMPDAMRRRLERQGQRIADAGRRYRMPERAMTAAKAMIYLAVTQAHPDFAPQGFCAVERYSTEVEFLCLPGDVAQAMAACLKQHSPACEWACHDMPGLMPDAGKVFLKGFIDFIFCDRGRYYIVDWKSNLLPAYDAISMTSHVWQNFAEQIVIYRHALGLMLRQYHPGEDESALEERFGGVIYVFLRGIGAQGEGGCVFFSAETLAECLGDARLGRCGAGV